MRSSLIVSPEPGSRVDPERNDALGTEYVDTIREHTYTLRKQKTQKISSFLPKCRNIGVRGAGQFFLPSLCGVNLGTFTSEALRVMSETGAC